MEKKCLEVTFVRHAESEDNLKVKALCESLVALCRLGLPSLDQLLRIASLLKYDLDSEVSILGKRQIVDIQLTLNSNNFWSRRIDVIVHSPLIRATETCLGIVPPDQRTKIVCLEDLREITPFEQLSKSKVALKVAKFESWLRQRYADPSVSHIVVVGHCQYFNNLLGMKTLMRNCDVWRSAVTFADDNNSADCISRGVWTAPTLLFRSGLSEPHPIGKVFKSLPWLQGMGGWHAEEEEDEGEEVTGTGTNRANRSATSTGPRGGDEVEDDLTDEPVCRICQARQSETPGQRMLRPCLCSGSVSYVHLHCLNQWRSTSATAYFTCSVCRYNYNIQRTLIARVMTQEGVILGTAVCMVFAVCFALGLGVSGVIHYFKITADPVREVLELMQLDRYWLRCLLSNRYSPGRAMPQRAGGDFVTAMGAIYESTLGFNDKIREVVRVLRSPLPLQYVLCHPHTAAVLNVFLLGAIPVGCTGFFGFFVGALQQVRAGGGGLVVQGGFVIMWLASIGVQAVSRLCLVVGCAIAIREVYGYLLGKARVLSHRFGDMILEPHR